MLLRTKNKTFWLHQAHDETRHAEVKKLNSKSPVAFLGNTPPSATSPSPLQERRAAWEGAHCSTVYRELPYIGGQPLPATQTSWQRRGSWSSFSLSPRSGSQAVGTRLRGKCRRCISGFVVKVRQPLAAHCARNAEDVFAVCQSSRAAVGTDANPTRCCIRARSAPAGRYILTENLDVPSVGHSRQKA